jgi:hypothetical protein
MARQPSHVGPAETIRSEFRCRQKACFFGGAKIVAKGIIRFKGDSHGARLLVDQLRDFPLADHDDGPDSLEMSLRVMRHLVRPVVEPVEEFAYA